MKIWKVSVTVGILDIVCGFVSIFNRHLNNATGIVFIIVGIWLFGLGYAVKDMVE